MIWSKDEKQDGARAYHHGNLREALVRAALDLIAKKGPAGFTFAEAARVAGVSPAAPYRHYRDRDDLMADIALRGFNLLERELARAWNEGTPTASVALENLGKAYLRFARTEPSYYSAMFEAGIPLVGNLALRDAGERVFAILRSATEKLIASLPPRSRPPALMMSLHIWALSHGIASLFGRGDAARRTLPMAPEDLLEAAILIYGEGLAQGHRPDDERP
jgi:AcrR family transcriptional regulator